jgi:peptide deformylase
MATYQPKILERTVFGNPILRKKSKRLTKSEILSADIQHLISDLKYTCKKRKYGVGLAASQVGHSLAISVIGIKPTKARPDLVKYEKTIINPEITEYIGEKVGMWEGCLSFSSLNDPVFAKAERYPRVKVKYFDENAKLIEEVLDGLAAHVFQHETDHCNGILFVDRVKDSSTWMNSSEYRKMVKDKNK